MLRVWVQRGGTVPFNFPIMPTVGMCFDLSLAVISAATNVSGAISPATKVVGAVNMTHLSILLRKKSCEGHEVYLMMSI
jgi:hypothetical protein